MMEGIFAEPINPLSAYVDRNREKGRTGREDLGANCLSSKFQLSLKVRQQIERERIIDIHSTEENSLFDFTFQLFRFE